MCKLVLVKGAAQNKFSQGNIYPQQTGVAR